MFHKNLNGSDLHSPSQEKVENNSGSLIPAFKAVTFASLGTAYPEITVTAGSADATRGITQANIADSSTGYIACIGYLDGIDTSAWTPGTMLYADSSGDLTSVSSGNGAAIAVVLKQDSMAGILYVNVNRADTSTGGIITSVFGRTGAITAQTGDYNTDQVTEATNLYYTQTRFDSAFAGKSTSDLAEGSNLYYTSARFDSAFAGKTTSNLAEGSNLYYTSARFNSAFATKTTDNLTEGSTNLYYTSARFTSAFNAAFPSAFSSAFATAFAAETTDSLTEGATNLYYTSARFDSAFAGKSTTDLAEGTNLYYTQTRFDSAFGAKTTSDLTEGTNLYYTTARFNSAFAGKSTSDLTEGSNLYFTNSRADARITAQKGMANGLAELDSGGKVPISQIPSSLIGAVTYQGLWNANTNSPTLTSSTGTQGFYYLVSVAGSTTLDGNTDWHVGDWVVFDGNVWEKIDNYQDVTSVFGRVGNVVATAGDYTTDLVTEGTNLYYTSARFNSAFAAKTTSDLTEGSNLYFTDSRAQTAAVENAINSGTTNKAPSEDAVYNGLAGKASNVLGNLGITSINADLLPGSTNTRALGSSSLVWQTLWINEILAFGQIDFQLTTGKMYNYTGGNIADFNNELLNDTSTKKSIDWQNRQLIDSGGTNIQLSWSTSGVGFNQLTATTVPYLNSSKVLTSSSVTPTELGYVSGVTSAIQTQLNGKQATGSYITALTGHVVASGPGSASATIQSGVIVDSMVSSSAAIQGTKIVSSFGSQDIDNTGNINASGPSSQITATSAVSGGYFIPTGTTAPTLGMYSPSGSNIGFSVASTEVAYLDSSAGLQMVVPFISQPNDNTFLTLTGSSTTSGAAKIQLYGQNAAGGAAASNIAISGSAGVALQWTNSTSTWSSSKTWSLTGAVTLGSTVTISGGTASTVPYLDSSKHLVSSSVTPTELGYVSGVTSAIQTQLNGKQATGSYITALTGDVTASGPGSVAATIASNAVTNAKLAQVGANTLKGNNTGSTANAADLTVSQVLGMLSLSGFTAGSVLFANSSGLVAQNNAKFFWDNTNSRLGLGTTSPQHVSHSHVGSATAIYSQWTNSVTGATATDGLLVGIDSSGNAIVTNQEATNFNLSNNGATAIQVGANPNSLLANNVILGSTPSSFQSFSMLDVSQNISFVGGGLSIGQSIVPTIQTDTDGQGTYYGLAIQPVTAGGPNGLDTIAGAVFAVSNGNDGSNNLVLGLQMLAQYTGGGTLSAIRGVTSSADGGGATSDLISIEANEPTGFDPSSSQYGTALFVSGTLSVNPTDDSSTGTVNQLQVPTSFIYMNGGSAVTLNGITSPYQGKYLEIYNATGSSMTINNNSGSAAAGEKILTVSGSAYTLLSKHTARLRYYGNPGSGNWLLLLD